MLQTQRSLHPSPPNFTPITAFALPLTAQETAHSGHTMTGTKSPVTKAFTEADLIIHTDMTIDNTGNPNSNSSKT